MEVGARAQLHREGGGLQRDWDGEALCKEKDASCLDMGQPRKKLPQNQPVDPKWGGQ